MITSLLSFAVISQSSWPFSFKLNCLTIPFGTVLLKLSLVLVAFVNVVISPKLSHSYIDKHTCINSFTYYFTNNFIYSTTYIGIGIGKRVGKYGNEGQSKTSKGAGHIEGRNRSNENRTPEAFRVQGKGTIKHRGLLHGY